MEGNRKRVRDDNDDDDDALQSLSRPITPPPKKAKPSDDEPRERNERENKQAESTCAGSSSPWQLTWIQDLPEDHNKDAVTLRDLLGDPLISECWEFNFLHDVRFLMDAFDPDTRHLVKVHIVHGFWKQNDPRRQLLSREASGFDNVELHAAFMPEMFGTHHSKMMILIRHDETAQVIIHTANMIPKDWTNMTNAIWKSPPLPLAADTDRTEYASLRPDHYPVGSGQRFKMDLMSYLGHYDRRRIVCGPLVEQLRRYDFSAIKAALIASVPGKHNMHDLSEPAWGWPALKRHLSSIPVRGDDGASVVIQVSSIATLGATDDWMRKTLFESLSRSATSDAKRPEFKVVFPTPNEIRRSLDGYNSGASIHTKIQSQQQAKQLQYLRPILHHWANDAPGGREIPADAVRHDGRRARAAPHIKTYIRYNGNATIDWALLTSANLSKQAWGEAARQQTGEVRIASWEIGVLVWPELLAEGSVMVPTFGNDDDSDDSATILAGKEQTGPVLGVRVPYNMPLQRYGAGETPWVASLNHTEPDRHGGVWMGET